jgi:N-sulfoglucosamine sulfohydrolase
VRLPGFIGVDTPKLRAQLADYYHCLAGLNAGVGMLLKELDSRGLTDRTLVIFLSDHGPQFLRGKLNCYESGLHVPLIVRWPHQIQPGVRNELISTIDLLPTIMEAVGGAAPTGLSGRSLLPLARGQNVKWREWIHAEFQAHYPPLYFPQRSISDGHYKMILNLLQDRPNPTADCYVSPRYQWTCLRIGDIEAAQPNLQRAYATWREAPPVELYDLHSDPYEFSNLADTPEFAEIRKQLLEQLTTWQRRTNDPIADPKLLAKLTQENDTLSEDYKTDVTFHWQYPRYLGPLHHDEKRVTTP